MVPYFEENGSKQHIHGKPICFGYKIWCLCTSCGFLEQAKLYQGVRTGNSTLDLGMGRSVVADLTVELPKDVDYKLFFDNLFTSLPLMEHLSKVGIDGTGTIRHNKTEKAPLIERQGMKRNKEVPSFKSLTKHLV